jgi:hypothetical protein
MLKANAHFPENWLADGVIDSEYKQFVLLAWLQRVRSEYDAARLYPALSESIEAHRKLSELSMVQKALDARSDGDVTGIDWKKMQLTKAASSEHPELRNYLNELIAFALPRIEESIDEGKALYNWVEEHVEFDPVGVVPLYKNEGYLLILESDDTGVLAFRYRKSKLEFEQSIAHQLEFELVDQTKRSFSTTLAQVKLNLIKRFNDLPNPATFLFRSKLGFPLSETLLPIAKRRLLRELALGA